MTRKRIPGVIFTHPDAYLIEALGGTAAAARLFDVKPPSVVKWRKTGMPKYRKVYLEMLRPDLFEGDLKPAQNQRKQSHCAVASSDSHA